MKQLTLLILFLLGTFSSISQPATVLDSTICIPKQYLIPAIQDIEAGDLCAEELQITKQNLAIKDSIISSKDGIIENTAKINESLENSISILSQKDSINNIRVETLKADLRKVKFHRVILGVGIIGVTLVGLYR